MTTVPVAAINATSFVAWASLGTLRRRCPRTNQKQTPANRRKDPSPAVWEVLRQFVVRMHGNLKNLDRGSLVTLEGDQRINELTAKLWQSTTLKKWSQSRSGLGLTIRLTARENNELCGGHCRAPTEIARNCQATA